MGASAATAERRLGRGWALRRYFRSALRGIPADWFAFAVLAVLAAIAVAHFGRAWSFFYDEWGVIFYRRSGGLAAFAAPLNGHLVAVPVAIYRLLFATAGLGSYTPYRWVTIVAHLGLGALVFTYARRRLPSLLALITVAPLLFLGYAWEVLFWMMNLGFIIPLLSFLAILLIADLAPQRVWAAAGQALLLAVALASSGLGVAVAAGTLVDSLIVRRRWRELPWLALPVLGYVLWFFLYRPGAATPAALRSLPGATPQGDIGALGFSVHNLHRMPHYILVLAESAAGGLLGARAQWVWLLLVAGLIVAGLVSRRRLTPRFVSLAVTLGVFWLLTSLVRAEVGQPASSRYIYPGAVLLVLLLAESWRDFGWTAVGEVWLRRAALVLLAGGALLAVASGVRHMQKTGDGAESLFARTNVELARLSCPPSGMAATYAPDPTFMPFVRLGPYRAATRELGRPVPARLVRSVCGGRG